MKIESIKLSNKDIVKMMNPTEEYLRKRDAIFEDIRKNVKVKRMGNGVVKVEFEKEE